MRRTWTKTDIINRLGQLKGYRRYLEICTTVTGNFYRKIDRSIFTTCHRLMFRCPGDFDDGMPIDFRVEGCDIAACVRRIKAQEAPYDAILVDPWHEYETSRAALEAALDLIDEHGAIVVHDCLPPTPRHAAPHAVDGDWCGVTYRGSLDLVLSRRDVDHLTIDTDFGCGVIRSRGEPRSMPMPPRFGAARLLARMLGRDRHAALVEQWLAFGEDYDAAFRFLHAHKKALLNLVPARQFWRLTA